MSEIKQTELKGADVRRPDAAPRNKTHAEIVYTPLDPGDPHETEFAGLKFRANVPVQVPLTRTVDSLVKKEYQTPEGEQRSRHVNVRVPVTEILKGNPFFRIDGEQPVRDRPHTKIPDSPEAYRGYAITWIAGSIDAKSMKMRWEMEKPLRSSCGVDKADIDYIMPLFEMRYDELAAAASSVAA